MYLLYKITNKLNNKSYIGITKHTLNRRWQCHLRTAFNKEKDYKFSRAIRKYGKDAWTKEVLFKDVPEDKIEALEIAIIEKYNSTIDGYNTSKGGFLPKGITPKKGLHHHSTNKTIYNFYGLDGRVFTGTKYHFAKKFGYKLNSVSCQTSRNQFIDKNWTIDIGLFVKANEKNIKKSRDAKRKKLAKQKREEKSRIRKQTTKIPRSMKGINNPMYGKTQSQKTKNAVAASNKARASLDKYDWEHSSGVVEKQLTTTELRDKYNLNISHLKKIADKTPKYNTHKGWKLHVEKSR